MTDEAPFDDDDMLAAEYALRLLSGDELAEARRRVGSDPAFAQRVVDWEMRLSQLTEDLAPQPVDARVKTALMDELFPAPARAGLFASLRIWQGLTLAAVLALAVLSADYLAGPGAQSGPLYTAEIAAEAGDFRVVAVVDKTTNSVFLTRTEGSAPAGRILQVWAHGEGAPAISVGLWPEGDSVRLPLPQTIADVTGILTLGVSEEPPGGSLTGSPSGRVFGTVDIPGVVQP